MRRGVLAITSAGWLLGAPVARAEIVYLSSGRTVSVRSLQFSGDTAVLTLRSGGEIECPRALIAEVLPDEVPYPETAEVVEAEPASAPIVRGADARDRLPVGQVPFGDLIRRASAAHGVEARLVQAVIHVESGY